MNGNIKFIGSVVQFVKPAEDDNSPVYQNQPSSKCKMSLPSTCARWGLGADAELIVAGVKSLSCSWSQEKQIEEQFAVLFQEYAGVAD